MWSSRRRRRELIDIAVPGDVRVEEKEEEKVTKYQCLAREVKRLWQLKSVNVIPVVVGALGTIPKKLELYLEKRGTEVPGSLLQKVALLGAAGTLRQVFGEDVGV